MQDIIDRIAKLLALATSANEHEAAAAMNKANEILMQHNLNLEDIKTTQTSEAAIKQDEIDASNRKKVFWKGSLASALATANFCKMWWIGGKIIFAGKPHNIAIARSLYNYLITTIDRLATTAVKTEKQNYKIYMDQIAYTGIAPFAEPNWRTWKSSFITGCAKRLTERIHEQTRAMNQNGIPDTTVTGLACRQAHDREQQAIAIWRREQGISLRPGRTGSKAAIARDGFAAGERAGNSIGLNRQVNAGSSSGLFR